MPHCSGRAMWGVKRVVSGATGKIKSMPTVLWLPRPWAKHSVCITLCVFAVRGLKLRVSHLLGGYSAT
jgi:hypothetical protein